MAVTKQARTVQGRTARGGKPPGMPCVRHTRHHTRWPSRRWVSARHCASARAKQAVCLACLPGSRHEPNAHRRVQPARMHRVIFLQSLVDLNGSRPPLRVWPARCIPPRSESTPCCPVGERRQCAKVARARGCSRPTPTQHIARVVLQLCASEYVCFASTSACRCGAVLSDGSYPR